MSSQQKWDALYTNRSSDTALPAQVLAQHSHLLPSSGRCLDLACGLGGNALYLASHGLNVDALDISSVAIEKLKNHPEYNSLINASACDVLSLPLSKNSYDVVVVSRFLERSLIPQLISALKPSGLIFYQTFIQDKASDGGPSNPAFLLAHNELLQLFSSLALVYYREEASIGNTQLGFRNEAMLIAQRIPAT
jgi:2-polyprenyl-3-methyl-5-hydroxy-6-metoxy-1,4-benzoquinol methylase